MSKKRKTKKEKVIAELRRKLQATKEKTSPLPPRATGSPRVEAGIASGDARQYPASNISCPTAYLKRDLTKTFVLAILAISLEIVLYFLLG